MFVFIKNSQRTILRRILGRFFVQGDGDYIPGLYGKIGVDGVAIYR